LAQSARKCSLPDTSSQYQGKRDIMLNTRQIGVLMGKRIPLIFGLVCCLIGTTAGSVALLAQGAAKSATSANDISGMYTFLRDGEFVQLTVEDGKLSGYLSRYGESDSDKGQFIDQFFDKTSLVGDRLTFNTKTVHGVWYDFNGRVTTTPGKQPASEGYRVMKGTLIQHATDDKGSEKSMERQVEFKSFPTDMEKQ
jgi:hypothetical protein